MHHHTDQPWCRIAFVSTLLLLISAASLKAQAISQASVTIVVTKDDLPTPNSKVTIRPRGTVMDWPEGKSAITLTTDARGLALTQLGAGKYHAIAHDPANSRLPAENTFIIKPGQTRTMKVHLNLLYWDCSKVTCML